MPPGAVFHIAWFTRESLHIINVWDTVEDWQRFADCMCRHGFDLSGETTVRVTPDGVTVNGRKVDADAFHAAEKECGPPWRGLGPRLGRGLPRLEGLPGRAELEAGRQAFLADVAKRLGVTTAQLEDALRDATVARIDELERSGQLGAAEAKDLRERARSGNLPFLGGPFLHGPPLFFRHFGEQRDSSGSTDPPDLPNAA